MNCCLIFFIVEIILIIYLFTLIYEPCYIKDTIKDTIENFVLSKEKDTQEIEPKLKLLQDKISPMFADNVEYSGILANINKKRLLNEIYT